jgi:hypothetical protein
MDYEVNVPQADDKAEGYTVYTILVLSASEGAWLFEKRYS